MTTISDPTYVFFVLLSIAGIVSYLTTLPSLEKFFDLLPPIIFLYFIPSLLSTFGIIPHDSPFYVWVKKYIMPMTVLLLVMTIDIPAILSMGKQAIIVTLAGSLGIVLGGPIIMWMFRDHLPEKAWMGLGALAASWTGGVGNFAAVAESFHTPSEVLAPAVIMDTVIGYGWMAIVLFCSTYQKQFDAWNKADISSIDRVRQRLVAFHQEHAQIPASRHHFMILALGIVGGFLLFHVVGGALPTYGTAITSTLWGIIVVIIGGIALSFTSLRRLEGVGASQVAYVGLYLLLTTIGAQGDLSAITKSPVFLLAGCVWIFIHLLFTLVAARLTKSPLFIVAISTMANVGGTVSTPIVAETYQRSMASAGLLMALLGVLVGTQCGIISGLLMRWVQEGHW